MLRILPLDDLSGKHRNNLHDISRVVVYGDHFQCSSPVHGVNLKFPPRLCEVNADCEYCARTQASVVVAPCCWKCRRTKWTTRNLWTARLAGSTCFATLSASNAGDMSQIPAKKCLAT